MSKGRERDAGKRGIYTLSMDARMACAAWEMARTVPSIDSGSMLPDTRLRAQGVDTSGTSAEVGIEFRIENESIARQISIPLPCLDKPKR